MRVLFSPTKTNCFFVEVAKLSPRLRQCTFEPLSERIEMRVQQLRAIEGRAAFIWGDGEHHHESYFFTHGRARTKINIDQHSDLTSDGFVSFYGHMAHSREDGMHIITPGELDRDIPSLVARALAAGAKAKKPELALTIDCDAIPCFPARGEWILYEGFDRGLKANEILDLVCFLAPKLSRLDMGGMVEGAEPFDFAEIRAPPPFLEAKVFSKKPASGASEVGNFAFTFYMDVLSAFARLGRLD